MNDWARQITDDLAWREAELASMKKQILEVAPGSPAHRVLLRAALALLYAHYEGFCKIAWEIYIEALSKSGLRRLDCRPQIACFSMQRAFRELRGDLSPGAIWEFCTKTFRELLSQPLEFGGTPDTRSNLYPDLLSANCDLLELPHGAADSHALRLSALVSRRNDIAHGTKHDVRDLEEYIEYEDVVKLVMYELGLGVIDALQEESYRQPAG